MNKMIYLDNNATTRCDEDVYEAMTAYLKESYGNPSSLYAFGREIKEKINEARASVAKLLNAEASEIYFTSCASESNVTAIMSAIKCFPEKKHIITTRVEHASIMETMKSLSENGYHVTYLDVDAKGRLDLEELKAAIDNDTCLLSIMFANNELGNIYPIEEIGKIAREHDVLFHCDAVQAIGKTKIDVKELNIDMLSLSGHKINAPKGIGAIYIRKDIPFQPLIFGHQENNRRGGTENVSYIMGLKVAVDKLLEDDGKTNSKIETLRDFMEEEILKNIEDVVIYGDVENRLGNTSSMAFKDVKADELLLMLEAYGIFVSTGSACNSFEKEPSHVLTACRANLEEYSPIRISLGKYNTEEEIKTLTRTLINVINILRKRSKERK